MLDHTTRQWLDENEVIERHLLSRLSKDENKRFESLLQQHPELQDELEFQKMIIAGIRQIGRQEIKERLKSLISQSPSGRSAHTLTLYSFMKIAAAVAVLIGVSWFIYSRIATQQEPAPVTQQEEPRPKEKIEAPKSEKPVESKADNKKQIASKKSTEKLYEKPAIVSAPSETAAVKHSQKLNMESLKFLKPNELTVTLTVAGQTGNTKLMFKNPTDLSAVNLKETQNETDGRLEWFYVIYENRVLNIYLDNTKYLKTFKQAALTEADGQLTVKTPESEYLIDLNAKDKFKKAVLKK